jgi:hypothetical protein
MKFFRKKQKTEKELQAELKALCYKMHMSSTREDRDRYEKLLKEIFLLGSKPEMIIKE